jgi:hypothetical protein
MYSGFYEFLNVIVFSIFLVQLSFSQVLFSYFSANSNNFSINFLGFFSIVSLKLGKHKIFAAFLKNLLEFDANLTHFRFFCDRNWLNIEVSSINIAKNHFETVFLDFWAKFENLDAICDFSGWISVSLHPPTQYSPVPWYSCIHGGKTMVFNRVIFCIRSLWKNQPFKHRKPHRQSKEINRTHKSVSYGGNRFN